MYEGIKVPSSQRVVSVEEAVLEARERIMNSHILFGGVLSSLGVKFSKRFPHAAVDNEYIYFNKAWLASQSYDEIHGTVFHEVGHPTLLHSFRKGDREHGDWNWACDATWNLIAIEEGVTLPKLAIVKPEYAGMSSEEVYLIRQKQKQTGEEDKQESQDEVLPPTEDEDEAQTGEDDGEEQDAEQDGDESEDAGEDAGEDSEADADGSEGEGEGEDEGEDGEGEGEGDADAETEAEGEGEGDGQDGNEDFDPNADPADDEVLVDAADRQAGKDAKSDNPELDWRIKVETLANMAARAGQLGDTLKKELGIIKSGKEKWSDRLRDLIENADSAEDRSWRRVDRRNSGSDFLAAGEYTEEVQDIVIHLDTSGSMWSDEQMKAMAADIQDILVSRSFRRLYVLHVDTDVAHVEEFDPKVDSLNFDRQHYGGGGTAFAPSLVWLEDHPEVNPAVIIYLTDMQGYFPSERQVPNFPIIWLDYTGAGKSLLPQWLEGTSTYIPVDRNEM